MPGDDAVGQVDLAGVARAAGDIDAHAQRAVVGTLVEVIGEGDVVERNRRIDDVDARGISGRNGRGILRDQVIGHGDRAAADVDAAALARFILVRDDKVVVENRRTVGNVQPAAGCLGFFLRADDVPGARKDFAGLFDHDILGENGRRDIDVLAHGVGVDRVAADFSGGGVLERHRAAIAGRRVVFDEIVLQLDQIGAEEGRAAGTVERVVQAAVVTGERAAGDVGKEGVCIDAAAAGGRRVVAKGHVVGDQAGPVHIDTAAATLSE